MIFLPVTSLMESFLHTDVTLCPVCERKRCFDSKVYIIETVGSMVGGLLITFFLIQYLNLFTIAFSISLLNSLMSIFLLVPNQNPQKTSLQKTLVISSILLCLLFGYSLSASKLKRIHQSSIRSQWKGLECHS